MNKMVAVAKDVLSRLKKFRLYVVSNYYLNGVREFSFHDDDGAQENLCTLEGNCGVCALGAMFLSHIRLNNQVKMIDVKEKMLYNNGEEGDDSPNGRQRHLAARTFLEKCLKKITTKEQLALIEIAFELNDNILGIGKISKAKRQAAYNFGNRYYGDAERLKAIMENVVKNKGMFKP